jgi:hypothetical protein
VFNHCIVYVVNEGRHIIIANNIFYGVGKVCVIEWLFASLNEEV